MKRKIFILVIFLALVTCVWLLISTVSETNVKYEKIMGYDVTIKISNKHPFLVDHRRKLIIKKNNKIVTKQTLYPDNGSRVPLTVFKVGEKLTFVDCNGYWYELDTLNNTFKTIDWFWEKALPDNYIGTFRFRREDHENDSFLKEKTVNIDNVYLFKDP